MYASALQFDGLYTFPNPLSKVPAGAALQADNLTANKDGTADCRRGLAASGTTFSLSAGQYLTQFFSYQNRLLSTDTTGGLWYDSTGSLNWTKDSGTYLPPTGATKIRGVEANKNFYLATSTGVKKLEAYNSTPESSGMPTPPVVVAVNFATPGFLSNNSQCAYKAVFGYNDANGNLILGPPSSSVLLSNSTGSTSKPQVTVILVPEIRSAGVGKVFVQLYRTPQTNSLSVPPGAEYQLVDQHTLTSADNTANDVVFTDITTDALLGAALYTNPSQQGALQTNDRAPLCVDFCTFNGMTLYANCQTLQLLSIQMLAVPSNGDTITINGSVFTFKNAPAGPFDVAIVGGDITSTARNLVLSVTGNSATVHVIATYTSSASTLAGFVLLTANDFSVGAFTVTASVPASWSLGTGTSAHNVLPNGVFASKNNQPEAVPAVNLDFVGGGDQPIYRILPLRDRVILLKSDGVWVITGSTPSTLSITLLDSTIICIAPESARLLNNSVYCMSNQGVVSITESGVTIQSRNVEIDLIQLTGPSFTNFTSCCHAISYESERLYILAMPTATSDTYGTQGWCYNWVTNAWTHWTTDISSGLVNPFDNVLYCGRPLTNNTFAYKERKNYTYTDFMDDQFAVTITGVNAAGTVVTISGTPSASWVGYGLEQTVSGTLYIAIITAVNVASKTLTVDLTNSTTPGAKVPWANTSASVDVPITINFVGAPITAGFPHYFKDWGRVNFWFNGGNFQNINVGFLSDVQGTTQYVAAAAQNGYGFGPFGGGGFGGTSNYPQAIQTLVPTDAAKSRWIMPQLNLAFPQARFSYLGTTASYEILSDVSG